MLRGASWAEPALTRCSQPESRSRISTSPNGSDGNEVKTLSSTEHPIQNEIFSEPLNTQTYSAQTPNMRLSKALFFRPCEESVGCYTESVQAGKNPPHGSRHLLLVFSQGSQMITLNSLGPPFLGEKGLKTWTQSNSYTSRCIHDCNGLGVHSGKNHRLWGKAARRAWRALDLQWRSLFRPWRTHTHRGTAEAIFLSYAF